MKLINKFKLAQSLSPSSLDIQELVLINHQLTQGKQHLLIITQGIGTRTYTTLIKERALLSK